MPSYRTIPSNEEPKNLKIPDNIILMFQPPHCPESNPIEQIWQYLKKD